MSRHARWIVVTIIALLLMVFATIKSFALSPAQAIPLPPHNEILYTEGELNIIANVVNGEVGGITGAATITYADGTTVEADACLLHRIHARVLDNQVRSDLFPDSLRRCLTLYWSEAYTATAWKTSSQWQHCRNDVLMALYGMVEVPDNVLAATCDPHFAERYTAYRLWAKVKWNTGWTSGTFYYYKYGG